MILKNYHQTIKIPITQLNHWMISEPKDIEREMTGCIIDLFLKTCRLEPKIFIIGFRRTRKTNRGVSGIGRFHKNWNLFKEFHDKIDVKIGVKVT